VKILFIFGTRPEAIKLAPLVIKAREDKFFDPIVCVTGQHKEMLNQVLDFFSIVPEYDLKLMTENQSLAGISSKIMIEIDQVLARVKPDLVIVQGDTTSAFMGSLSSYYHRIPVVHIEAGLRTYDKYSPFPEEINRKLLGGIAEWHFAPTKVSEENLKKENIEHNVFTVGNTVIDALFLALKIIGKEEGKYYHFFKGLDFSKKLILVTCHRRENFGQPFKEICDALIKISEENSDVQIVYPVHPNPNIRENAHKFLGNISNIKLIDPLDYPSLLWLMNKAYFVITDSGGIQEEAPSLNKPVLIIRKETEREEGLKAGASKLIGITFNEVYSGINQLMKDAKMYEEMSGVQNPYGDGHTCERILSILKDSYNNK